VRRYADRAKQIKTTAIVNEDPVEKLIRELKEENDALKRQLQTGQINPADFVDADNDGINDKDMAKMKAKWEEEMRARMLQNDKEMIEMKKSYEEKLKAQKKDIAVGGVETHGGWRRVWWWVAEWSMVVRGGEGYGGGWCQN
jgi:hypothetical protein